MNPIQLKHGDKFFRVNEKDIDTFFYVSENPKTRSCQIDSMVAIDGNNYAKAVVLYPDKDFYTTDFDEASRKFIECCETHLNKIREIYS